MRTRPPIFRALVLVALATSTPSLAACLTAEQVQARSPEYWARYVLRRADVVVEAEVIRPYTGHKPEVLRTIEIYKGPSEPSFTLGLPDTLSTAAFPSTGAPMGARRIVALSKTSNGYVVGECEAGALNRAGLTPELMRQVAQRTR